MSRVGKLPISVPAKVEITLAANEITVKGPLGTLKQAASSDVIIKKDGDNLRDVLPSTVVTLDNAKDPNLWGNGSAK